MSTTALAAALGAPDLVVMDCRHDLVDHWRGERLYREGHIPDALFVPVETALAGRKTGQNGRHPLPVWSDLVGFLAAHGVRPDTRLVAYDDAGGLYAARLWWLARSVGVTRVMLLDGGLTQWQAEDRPLSAAVVAPCAVEPWTPAVSPGPVWTADDVSARLADPRVRLVDARAAERYRGEVEPMDPVAGHIPGAVNRFYRSNLRSDLTFRPAAELREEFTQQLRGAAPEHIAHYCGSGITACANLFAMEYAGLGGSALYAGSWSEWVANTARPVEKGAARDVGP